MVPVRDHAVRVGGNNGILDYIEQMRLEADLLLGLLALRDVGDDRRQITRLAVLVRDRKERLFNRDRASIPASSPRCDSARAMFSWYTYRPA